MALVYMAMALVALLLVRALFRQTEKPKVIMNYKHVNNPAVLRAAAFTNTSHRNYEPTEF